MVAAHVQCRADGPDSLGVLARLEIRDRDASENDDPLWLVEAWFAYERMIPPGAGVESSVQLLVPWERAIDWLDGQALPDSLIDPKQFQSLGYSELSADALEARK